jgi:phosphohistidine phosphatase
MKTLCLIRHAKSSWDQAGLADIDRPLNLRGKATAPIMAEKLVERGLKPDLIISSPAKRARQTAKYFRKKYQIKKEAMQIEPSIYHGDENSMLDLIRTIPDKHDTVFIFGHNPTMNYLSVLFSDQHLHIPTCGIQWLELDINQWSAVEPNKKALREFIYPKQYIPDETNE